MRYIVAVCLSLGCAGPALADLTAEDVLADQLNLLSGYGLLEMTTTGTTSRPDGLSVDGFLGTYVDEEDGDRVTVSLPGVDLVEQPDGSVQIVYPAQLPVTVSSNTEDGPRDVTIRFELQDVVHVVSGTEDTLQHSLEAARVAYVSIEGVPDGEIDEVDLTLFLEGLNSTLRFVEGDADARNLEFSLDRFRMSAIGDEIKPSEDAEEGATQLEAVDMAIDLAGSSGIIGFVDSDVPQHLLTARFDTFDWVQDMKFADEEEAMSLVIRAADTTVNYDIALSVDALEKDFTSAIRSGQFARGAMRYGSMVSDIGVVTPDGPISMESSNGRASVEFSLDERGISLSASAVDTVAKMSGPASAAMPFSDLGYEVGSVRYGVQMPILPSDDSQPFSFDIGLEGLTISDEIWALFDPEARIPRDPVDLVLDLSGTTVVTEDPFTADDGVVPFEATEAALNKLRFAVAGAVLTGEGSVVDTSTPGNPSGIGKLNAMLTGGNTLLDTLIEMGLVDTNQAMAARMALGVVARSGDGPDTLVSEIEVNEEGHIFANGQRIK